MEAMEAQTSKGHKIRYGVTLLTKTEKKNNNKFVTCNDGAGADDVIAWTFRCASLSERVSSCSRASIVCSFAFRASSCREVIDKCQKKSQVEYSYD